MEGFRDKRKQNFDVITSVVV